MIHFTAVAAMIVSLSASIAIGAGETGLTWSSRVAAVEAEIGAEKVHGSFTFTNAGEEPVTILSALTGCGCTVATLEKKTYAPGETGRIDVTFDPQGETGVQTKYITVRSAPAPGDGREAAGRVEPIDLGAPPKDPRGADDVILTTLTLKVTIPEPLEVRPRLVYWRPGEPRSPRTVRIKVVRDKPLHVFLAPPPKVDGDARAVEDAATPPANARPAAPEAGVNTPAAASASPFKTELKELEPGRLYELTITPPLHGPAARGTIALHTELNPEHPQTATVLARIFGDSNDDNHASEARHAPVAPD